MELTKINSGAKGIRPTKIKKDKIKDCTSTENMGRNRETLINIAVNKFRNLYQLVFELDEKLTEREYTECQNTIKEVSMKTY